MNDNLFYLHDFKVVKTNKIFIATLVLLFNFKKISSFELITFFVY